MNSFPSSLLYLIQENLTEIELTRFEFNLLEHEIFEAIETIEQEKQRKEEGN